MYFEIKHYLLFEYLLNLSDALINHSKRKSTAIFCRDWFDKGILFIQQFKDDKGHWLSYDQFSVKYNLFDCVSK